MIVYQKLWALLSERGMKKAALLEILPPSTIAKLGKNATLNTLTIDKICRFLDCQPADIMSYENEFAIQKQVSAIGELLTNLITMMKSQGISKEQVLEMMQTYPIPEGMSKEECLKLCEDIFDGKNVFAEELKDYLPK